MLRAMLDARPWLVLFGGLPRALRRRLTPPLIRFGSLVLPRLYLVYMGLVWRTSRIEDHGLFRLRDVLGEYGGAVAVVWHEEVLGVAYAYPHLGFRPHTLASRSNAGELVTRLLERCGYTVFRGGASGSRARRQAVVWRRMIEHMRSHDDVLYGLTVDGSRGPAYRLKRGALVVARDCRKPVVLVRTWYARCLRLPTWDRSALPLPFNRIRYAMRGPYPVPEEARSRPGLERFRRQLEGDLVDLAAESYDAFGQARPPNLVKRAAAT